MREIKRYKSPHQIRFILDKPFFIIKSYCILQHILSSKILFNVFMHLVTCFILSHSCYIQVKQKLGYQEYEFLLDCQYQGSSCIDKRYSIVMFYFGMNVYLFISCFTSQSVPLYRLRRVVRWAEETSTYSWPRFCTVNP